MEVYSFLKSQRLTVIMIHAKEKQADIVCYDASSFFIDNISFEQLLSVMKMTLEML